MITRAAALLAALALSACVSSSATTPSDLDMKWAAATSVRPQAPDACNKMKSRPRLGNKDYSDVESWSAYWKLDAHTARLEGRHAACGTWARAQR